tara:strand:- start:3108 stop:4049 length:942 start_codon:yes stop_codon:yes gene_type:complete
MSISFALATEELSCEDADLVVDVDMSVTGQGCHWRNHIEDSTLVSIPKEGTHTILGVSERGSPDSCQEKEEFFLEINGETGIISEDDTNACAITTREEFLGEFPFTQGENEITMHTAASCPPEPLKSSNSVDLTQICIFFADPEPPVIPCDTNLDCGTDGFVDSPFCSEDDVLQNYQTFTCNNPGTEESFCSSETAPKLLEQCSLSCSDGECSNNNRERSRSWGARIIFEDTDAPYQYNSKLESLILLPEDTEFLITLDSLQDPEKISLTPLIIALIIFLIILFLLIILSAATSSPAPVQQKSQNKKPKTKAK